MAPAPPDAETARATMVGEQLEARGISDQRVLDAMRAVPREAFVPAEAIDRAYEDGAVAIGHDQTISQPWIVAAICQGLALTGSETVLEIGTGSGYSAAVLARLARRVVSIERIAELSATAAARLAAIGADVELVVGDGSLGQPLEAPYEAIAVHAAIPAPPRALLGQLAPGGRLVAPLVTGRGEYLTQISRDGNPDGSEAVFSERRISACRFVPLIGAEGFPEPRSFRPAPSPRR